MPPSCRRVCVGPSGLALVVCKPRPLAWAKECRPFGPGDDPTASPVARRPSPVARRPSPVARRPSPVARRPSLVARRSSLALRSEAGGFVAISPGVAPANAGDTRGWPIRIIDPERGRSSVELTHWPVATKRTPFRLGEQPLQWAYATSPNTSRAACALGPRRALCR